MSINPLKPILTLPRGKFLIQSSITSRTIVNFEEPSLRIKMCRVTIILIFPLLLMLRDIPLHPLIKEENPLRLHCIRTQHGVYQNNRKDLKQAISRSHGQQLDPISPCFLRSAVCNSIITTMH
jgi:hypothetical protein